MKRLIRKAGNEEQVINSIKNSGREILKSLEDYKFLLFQSSKLTANNSMMSSKLEQKSKELDRVSSNLYEILFEIENMTIVQPMVENNMESFDDSGFNFNNDLDIEQDNTQDIKTENEELSNSENPINEDIEDTRIENKEPAEDEEDSDNVEEEENTEEESEETSKEEESEE